MLRSVIPVQAGIQEIDSHFFMGMTRGVRKGTYYDGANTDFS